MDRRSRGSLDQDQSRQLQMSCSDEDEVFTCADAIEACGFGRFQIQLSFFAGLLWMVDAMEIMVLSILAPTARCYFHLETWQESLISTVVFASMTIGAGLWGKLMDKYGRRKGIFVFCVFVAISSLASAFAPSYPLLLVLRGIVGFGLSGGAQAVTFYLEFLPSTNRGYCLVFLELFFCVGTSLEVLLAMLLLGHFQLSWHWLLGFTAVPVFIDLLAFVLVPESAFYLMTCNKTAEARKVLERVARVNRKELPRGRLVSKAEKERIQTNWKDVNLFDSSPNIQVDDASASDEKDKSITRETTALIPQQAKESSLDDRGHLVDLFSTRLRGVTTVLLSVIWFGAAFGYYGVVFLTTEMLTIISQQDNNNSVIVPCIASAPAKSNSSCKLPVLDMGDYEQLLWTTAAEFPGVILTVLIIEKIGRKKTMVVEFSMAVCFFFLMYICPLNRNVLMLFIFGARASLTGAFQTVIVYTPEFYPTNIRALGTGVCNSLSRAGAMVTPFIAEVLLRKTIRGSEGIYAAACIICAVCAILLPVETKGRELEDLLAKKHSVQGTKQSNG